MFNIFIALCFSIENWNGIIARTVIFFLIYLNLKVRSINLK